MHHSDHAEKIAIDPFGSFLLLAGWLAYMAAVFVSNKKHRKWPINRLFLWSAGILCMALAFIGPLAVRSHTDFAFHMVVHLLLGMLAPLLMLLAAPMTLLLRTVNVPFARRLTRLLKSRFFSFFTHPITAAFLNIGGLYLLYTTDLYEAMHQSLILYAAVHVHVFLAGYLFTAAIIYIDPMPHRFGFIYRSVILTLALAGHGILSKYIYAHPPAGVSKQEAETGGMLMYYGGDAVDLLLIIILCSHWYKATRPNLAIN